MLDAILKAGGEAGFQTVEAFRLRTTFWEFSRTADGRFLQRAQGNRIAVRGFWERGEPSAFVLSVPDLKGIRQGFNHLRALVPPRWGKSFGRLLNAKAPPAAQSLWDPLGDEFGCDGERCERAAEDLGDALAESVIAFPGLAIKEFRFSFAGDAIDLANSNGFAGGYSKSRFRLRVAFTLRGRGLEVSETRLFFSQLEPARMVNRAYNLLASMTGEDVSPAGEERLIFTPEAAVQVLREFTDRFVLGAKSGTKNLAAATAFSLLDDPLLEGQAGSVPFDDEGSPGREKYILNKGVFVAAVADMETACRWRTVSTGNGFRDRRSLLPASGFSNLFIKPSVFSLHHLLHEAGEGILVSLVRLKYSRRQQGDFFFSAHGYRFRGGEIGAPQRFYFRTSQRTFGLRVLQVSKELRFFCDRFNIGSPYLLALARSGNDRYFSI